MADTAIGCRLPFRGCWLNMMGQCTAQGCQQSFGAWIVAHDPFLSELGWSKKEEEEYISNSYLLLHLPMCSVGCIQGISCCHCLSCPVPPSLQLLYYWLLMVLSWTGWERSREGLTLLEWVPGIWVDFKVIICVKGQRALSFTGRQ